MIRGGTVSSRFAVLAIAAVVALTLTVPAVSSAGDGITARNQGHTTTNVVRGGHHNGGGRKHRNGRACSDDRGDRSRGRRSQAERECSRRFRDNDKNRRNNRGRGRHRRH